MATVQAYISSERILTTKKNRNYTTSQKNNLIQFGDTKLNGKLSERTKSRLRNILTNLFNAYEINKKSSNNSLSPTLLTSRSDNDTVRRNKPTLQFYTLTLTNFQTHSDKEIKKCLSNVLRMFKANLYVWIAEKTKQNTIHFHILTDKDDLLRLRELWHNNILKLGYPKHHNSIVKKQVTSKYVIQYVLKGCDAMIDGNLYGMSRNMKEFDCMVCDDLKVIERMILRSPNAIHDTSFYKVHQLNTRDRQHMTDIYRNRLYMILDFFSS